MDPEARRGSVLLWCSPVEETEACPVPVTASTWHLLGETVKRYGNVLHLYSQILRGMNKVSAWFGWVNSMSAPVRMSV